MNSTLEKTLNNEKSPVRNVTTRKTTLFLKHKHGLKYIKEDRKLFFYLPAR